ncbi:MAG: hypothetical protein ACYCVZ_05670 [Streptosporangiaceae bacterium]
MESGCSFRASVPGPREPDATVGQEPVGTGDHGEHAERGQQETASIISRDLVRRSRWVIAVFAVISRGWH